MTRAFSACARATSLGRGATVPDATRWRLNRHHHLGNRASWESWVRCWAASPGGLLPGVSYNQILSFSRLITAIIGASIVLIIYGFIQRRTQQPSQSSSSSGHAADAEAVRPDRSWWALAASTLVSAAGTTRSAANTPSHSAAIHRNAGCRYVTTPPASQRGMRNAGAGRPMGGVGWVPKSGRVRRTAVGLAEPQGLTSAHSSASSA